MYTIDNGPHSFVYNVPPVATQKKRNTLRGVMLLMLVVALLCGLMAFTNNTAPVVDPIVSSVWEPRIEFPCDSPYYATYRTQTKEVPVTPGGDKGVRFAGGCPVEGEVQISYTEVLACPNPVLLFGDPGPIEIGDKTAGGGTVVEMKGNWIVSEQDGILLASQGRSIAISFPKGVYVHSALLFDNDPKFEKGESAWTLNNRFLPRTERRSWVPTAGLGFSTRHVVFEHHHNSPHFNLYICPAQ